MVVLTGDPASFTDLMDGAGERLSLGKLPIGSQSVNDHLLNYGESS